MGENDALAILDEASLSEAREWVRRLGHELALSQTVVESLTTAATELGNNQLHHARQGRFLARAISRDGVPGIEIVASDGGEGLAKPTAALEGANRSSGSLGAGLGGVLRLADEVDFDIRLREGTTVWARKFATPPTHKSEVAIFGRPISGESLSGDDAFFWREDNQLTLTIVDGLGHGILARDASRKVVELARQRGNVEPSQFVFDCDDALVGTRGAVMAVVAIGAGEMQHIGVGNIQTIRCRPRESTRFGGTAGTVGTEQPRNRWRTETAEYSAGDVVVQFTDGLTTRSDICAELQLLRQHPIVIAEHMLVKFGRDTDDALVMVARH